MPTDYHTPALQLTKHDAWAEVFWNDLEPLKNRISQHPFFQEMASGQLSLEAFRYALKNFYPLVAHFPAYMGLALAKVLQFSEPGQVETRNWLIHNIKVEERHLSWYQDWAMGFGLSLEELQQVRPPAAMNAVNHFLWDINMRGSLVESLAATNLAIEWATGDWTAQVYQGMQHYAQYPQVHLTKRTLAWLRAHAHYDDLHPYEAMELIKRICHDQPKLQQKAFLAAKEGLAYYVLALDDCYKVHKEIQHVSLEDLSEYTLTTPLSAVSH